MFNGQYAGTLTEGLYPRDALLSPSGDALHVAAEASDHTTLLVLDPATGQERRRAEVAVDGSRQLAWRGDGQLILAGWRGSGALDPQTLQLIQKLPPAERVSLDGEKLLTPITIDTREFVLLSSRTGAVLSKTLSGGFFPQFSDNLNWAADTDTLLNLMTGQTVDTASSHPDPCGFAGKSLLSLQGIADLPDGVAAAYNDGTLDWRTTAGTLRSSQKLGLGCLKDGLREFHVRAFGAPLLFQFVGEATDRPTFGEITEGQPPRLTINNVTTDLAYNNWFAGTFAYRTAARPLFLNAGPEPVLDNWKTWKQSYLPARYPVSADVQAIFRDANTYDMTGSVTGPSGPLTVRGTGSHTGQTVPGIVFTQVLCSAPPFGPNCPQTTWKADLLSGTDVVGSMTGNFLDPNATGSSRQPQEGGIRIPWNGEARSALSSRRVDCTPLPL